MMGGEGPKILIIMWVMTGIVFLLLLLRVYTRVFIVRSLGADDHVFIWSWVFLLLHNLFLHVSGNYGFGQDQRTLDPDDGAMAKMWEMIGQTFIILGMGMGKMSLALFLLRIVVEKWHRWSIWGVGGSLAFASFLTAILCWLQCLPPQRIYDTRVDGHCIIDPVPWAILLGCFCVFVDFFFAILPWIFLQKLEMKKKEKIIVGISLSFGVIAGISGIVRTVNLPGLGSDNYTGDTVSLVVWSAAELSLTLGCIAVPTIIPLYLRVTKTASTNKSHSSAPYLKHSGGTDDNTGHELHNISGTGPAGARHSRHSMEIKTAVNGPFNDVRIMYGESENKSDEAILAKDVDGHRRDNSILVTEEVVISRAKRAKDP